MSSRDTHPYDATNEKKHVWRSASFGVSLENFDSSLVMYVCFLVFASGLEMRERILRPSDDALLFLFWKIPVHVVRQVVVASFLALRYKSYDLLQAQNSRSKEMIYPRELFRRMPTLDCIFWVYIACTVSAMNNQSPRIKVST